MCSVMEKELVTLAWLEGAYVLLLCFFSCCAEEILLNAAEVKNWRVENLLSLAVVGKLLYEKFSRAVKRFGIIRAVAVRR